MFTIIIIICAMSHILSSIDGNILPQVRGSEILSKERTVWYKMKLSSHHNSSFTASKLVFNVAGTTKLQYRLTKTVSYLLHLFNSFSRL
jgi:hypothetical protein